MIKFYDKDGREIRLGSLVSFYSEAYGKSYTGEVIQMRLGKSYLSTYQSLTIYIKDEDRRWSASKQAFRTKTGQFMGLTIHES